MTALHRAFIHPIGVTCLPCAPHAVRCLDDSTLTL
jgi:hypothetical protein